MRAVIQRVSQACVRIDGLDEGAIQTGYVVLLGITHTDTSDDVVQLARKIRDIRLFPDEHKPINRNILDVDGEILLISQFTLYADTRSGNRPSFTEAARPDHAQQLYDTMKSELAKLIHKPIQSGIFGAKMDVTMTNTGPVTIVLDTEQRGK